MPRLGLILADLCQQAQFITATPYTSSTNLNGEAAPGPGEPFLGGLGATNSESYFGQWSLVGGLFGEPSASARGGEHSLLSSSAPFPGHRRATADSAQDGPTQGPFAGAVGDEQDGGTTREARVRSSSFDGSWSPQPAL